MSFENQIIQIKKYRNEHPELSVVDKQFVNASTLLPIYFFEDAHC